MTVRTRDFAHNPEVSTHTPKSDQDETRHDSDCDRATVSSDFMRFMGVIVVNHAKSNKNNEAQTKSREACHDEKRAEKAHLR